MFDRINAVPLVFNEIRRHFEAESLKVHGEAPSVRTPWRGGHGHDSIVGKVRGYDPGTAGLSGGKDAKTWSIGLETGGFVQARKQAFLDVRGSWQVSSPPNGNGISRPIQSMDSCEKPKSPERGEGGHHVEGAGTPLQPR